jgi:ArsR family transcriptional regulator, virulence genes transcriptional regulator
MVRDAKTAGRRTKSGNGARLATAADLARLQDNAARACTLLKAMGNPARLLVLCEIAHGEKSVGELERTVGLSQSGLSQHLAVLRGKHLVATRRDAQTIYYSLASEEAAAVMSTLYRVFCGRAAKQPAAKPRARAA